MIARPGIVLDMPEAEYHADPCPEPSLSSSIAHLLVRHSPRHAFLKHPRLGKAPDEEFSKQAALGTAAHACLLGNDDRRITVLDCDDYVTKAARAARDAALTVGMVPVTAAQWQTAQAMAEAAREQLVLHDDIGAAFDPDGGQSEVTLIWQRGPTWCRARVDRLPNDGRVLIDYKTTSGSAHPEDVQRRLFDTGADIQQAHYLDGAAACGIKARHMLFVVQETEPPYLLSVVGMDAQAADIGKARLRRAHLLWQHCLATSQWPGYATRTCWIEPPAWEVKREEIAPDDLPGLLRAWERWQAPIGWQKGEAA